MALAPLASPGWHPSLEGGPEEGARTRSKGLS